MGEQRHSAHERYADRVAPWVGRLAALLGIASVFAGFAHSNRGSEWFGDLIPGLNSHLLAVVSIPAGLMMLWLSRGLTRRKRRAWQASVAAALLLLVLHVLRAHQPVVILLSVVMVALLAGAGPAFHGAPDPRNRNRTLVAVIAAAAVATCAGVALVLAPAPFVVGSPTAVDVLDEVWLGFVGIPGGVTYSNSRVDDTVGIGLVLLAVLAVVTILATALRPAAGPHPQTAEEESRLRALLQARSAQDSLGYFALRDDKSVIFSPTGKAAVAYAVVGGAVLASGDPIGDPEAWPGAISAWLQQAEHFAWVPGVLGASERGALAYQRAGLDALELGDEALIDVPDFQLTSRRMRSLRQAVNRARRNGVQVLIDRAGDLEPAELQRWKENVAQWRAGQGEHGFSMSLGRFGEARDADCIVVRCFDAQDRPSGVLSLVPWGADGLSLDLMCRAPEADNGAMEAMVVGLLEWMQGRAMNRLSLNFAVFRAVFERGGRLGAGPVLRLWHRVLLVASRFWQIESLYRANAKYSPVWEPRFVCFRRARELPGIGMAALQAEAFLALPRWIGGRGRPRERSLGDSSSGV